MRAGCDGGGKGALIGDNLSHTLQTGNDQTIVTLTEDTQWWDGSDQAGTLTGTSNNQLMPDKGRLPCVIEPAVECFDTRQVEVQETELAPTLIATDHTGGNGVGAQEELAYTQNATGVMGVCTKGNGDAFLSDVHTSLSVGGWQAGQGYPAALQQKTVRRLLVVEAERLMGFPDNHTRISWNGKPEKECPDAPRYKACGNSFCVNVVEWIGRRIEEFAK
jgi:site-specific DNA-cytosine methylase